MNRMITIATGFVVLGLGVYCGSRLSAGTRRDAPAEKHSETRIATVNLAYIVKSYGKATQYEKEFQIVLAKYEAATQDSKSRLETKEKELKAPATQAERKPWKTRSER